MKFLLYECDVMFIFIKLFIVCFLVARIIHMMDVLYNCANARYYFVSNIPNVVSDYPLTKKIFNSEFCMYLCEFNFWHVILIRVLSNNRNLFSCSSGYLSFSPSGTNKYSYTSLVVI